MIKIGIIGAESKNAGELLRLLINHSEVDIVTLYAPMLAGRSVAGIHHGFIGEQIVNFSEKFFPEDLDIVFVAESDDRYKELLQNLNNYPEIRIIDLTGNNTEAIGNNLLNLGLSEINRKNLVRTSTKAYIPTPDLILPLIAMTPLSHYMLLNSPLSITLSVPASLIKEGMVDTANSKFLSQAFTVAQPSFNSPVNLIFEENKEEERVISMHTIIDCTLSIEEIERIYEGIYDDHNFTFVVHSPVSHKEVEGTQKSIISLNKPSPSTLEIFAVADARMRGGAGDALHVMNLLKGLYEKTGLQLKSSAFSNPEIAPSSSWFA